MAQEAPAGSDASYRLRLEGRAELLEVARLRLTALRNALTAFRWRTRLRANTALLRETASAQPEVEEALAHVGRRAEAEAWPATSDVVRCAADVEKLSNRVASLAFRRLGLASRPDDLSQRLEKLELLVLASPRLILPGQRWKTAQEVLPLTLPEVQRAAQFISIVEPLFKRPMQASQPLPFPAGEIDQLTQAWPPTQRALSALWTRIGRIDAAGNLGRFLRRRASITPKHPPHNGAEVLLAAEFWSGFATARLHELVQARVDPIACEEGELFTVVRWLVTRQSDADARLPAGEVMAEGRAGLFELAVELSAIPPRPQAKSPNAAGWWRRLAERAQRAQPTAGDASYQKLEDNLRLFLRVLERPDNTPPVYRALATLPHLQQKVADEAGTLVELVEAMRVKLS
jgi:hypothetical protein